MKRWLAFMSKVLPEIVCINEMGSALHDEVGHTKMDDGDDTERTLVVMMMMAMALTVIMILALILKTQIKMFTLQQMMFGMMEACDLMWMEATSNWTYVT